MTEWPGPHVRDYVPRIAWDGADWKAEPAYECAECKEPWPCRAVRVPAVARFRDELRAKRKQHLLELHARLRADVAGAVCEECREPWAELPRYPGQCGTCGNRTWIPEGWVGDE